MIEQTMSRRWMVTGVLLVVIAALHWLLPREALPYHALHVAMRKAFLLPVVLAAIWFSLPGALVVAFIASLLYVPHVVLQWGGYVHENINQVGEIVTFWIVAVICGWLVNREKAAIHETADANEGALLALIGTLDARKQKRRFHSMRVYAYAIRIARKLNLSLDDIEVLAQVSVLHDLGMISVPDQVLFKQGPLTDEEWASIHKHPGIGYRIVRRVPSLRRAAKIVYAHHERFNGTGYPRQLAGDAIPFLARVFSVADVFDAITTDRRYGKALSLSDARQVIANESGSQFDPQVVEAFLRITELEWEQVLQQLEVRVSEMERASGQTGPVLDAEMQW